MNACFFFEASTKEVKVFRFFLFYFLFQKVVFYSFFFKNILFHIFIAKILKNLQYATLNFLFFYDCLLRGISHSGNNNN
jgi:hypothetical protein